MIHREFENSSAFVELNNVIAKGIVMSAVESLFGAIGCASWCVDLIQWNTTTKIGILAIDKRCFVALNMRLCYEWLLWVSKCGVDGHLFTILSFIFFLKAVDVQQYAVLWHFLVCLTNNVVLFAFWHHLHFLSVWRATAPGLLNSAIFRPTSRRLSFQMLPSPVRWGDIDTATWKTTQKRILHIPHF